MMRTRSALRAAPWLAGTAVVVFTATVTLSILGRDLLGTKAVPMTQSQVRQRLAHYGHGPAMMAGPAGRHRTAPGPTAVPDAKMYQGNIVYAACDKGQVTLTFIPAMSYRMIGDVPGPAPVTFVRFSAGSPDTTVTVTVTCNAHRAPAFKAVTGKADTTAATGTGAQPGTGTTAGTGTGTGTAVTRPAGGTASTAPPADDGGGSGRRGGGGGSPGGGGGSPSPGGVTASPGGHGDRIPGSGG